MRILEPLSALNALAILKWLVALCVSIWASLSATVHALCILMAIDIVSGIAKACFLRKLSSEVSFQGLVRKVMTLIFVFVGHIITKPLGIGFDLGEVIALAFLVNEVVSIVENGSDMGISIPPILLQTLARTRSVMPNQGDSVTVMETKETVVIQPAASLHKDDKLK